jgi:death-on-curing protein
MSGKASREPRWVPKLASLTIHADQIATHGGLPGVRDASALDAALGRARNKWGDAKLTDLPTLAAACAFGIARSHPFNDGNKRTAFLTMVAFLGLNGIDFDAPEDEVVTAFTALAAGASDEAALATWVAKHARKLSRR